MLWSDLEVDLGTSPASDFQVVDVTYDSRLAAQGVVFVAIPGTHQDGHRFVAQALGSGAPVAVVERLADDCPRERQLLVADSRVALAELAAALNRDPSRDLPVIGVTGTDGKTTTTTMLQAALTASLGCAGSLTTIDFRLGKEVEPNLLRQTTLEAPEIQRHLREMADRGCRAAVVESTSHGLALHRLDRIQFAGAVFTNITHEHLDFHGTWENYFQAKATLLDKACSSGGFAVLNFDDPLAYQRLRQRSHGPTLTYSAQGSAGADLRAGTAIPQDGGISFTASTPAGSAPVRLRMAGRWNVGNALAALAAGLLLDQPLPTLVQGLEELTFIPGRMEAVDLGQPFSVIVDYAHTPAALSLALYELRASTPGRLIVVFGSAGERDRAKRPEMGRIAAHLADHVVVTTEDPRGEDEEAIIEEICRGAIDAGAVEGENLERISDRSEAIARAIAVALPGDTVLLAGKGHERSIIRAAGPVPWDERQAAEQALRVRLKQ
jgi:UDP-N-acetylmuramoyl-L-alanyl-D-glutamate--2,6-diaminopimelate ligase